MDIDFLDLEVAWISGHHGFDSMLKDLINAIIFFAAALHVLGLHMLRDRQPLLRGDWLQALGLQEVNAGALGAEVRLEANEEDGAVWAEVRNLRVPLYKIQLGLWVREPRLLPCQAHYLRRWGNRLRSK